MFLSFDDADDIVLDTLEYLLPTQFPAIQRAKLETLQVNLGYRCNQRCFHCHVAAGPDRTEEMDRQTMDLVLELLQKLQCSKLDLTGGAPELNPHFRYLVTQARALGVEVIDRCNLTILEEPGQESLADFLADQGVTIVASMPCYLAENVDAQRGKGTFVASIEGLKRLNARGYGKSGDSNKLVLDLVFNPQGASLPPAQLGLEADYKKHLLDNYGVTFNRLFTITNMPIKRFGSTLLSKGEFHPYMELLKDSYQASNLDTVMCRNLISVDWMGFLFDCDFNQMLDIPPEIGGKKRPHLRDLLDQDLEGNPIRVAEHCYGCTAGQGSSCGGALQE